MKYILITFIILVISCKEAKHENKITHENKDSIRKVNISDSVYNICLQRGHDFDIPVNNGINKREGIDGSGGSTNNGYIDYRYPENETDNQLIDDADSSYIVTPVPPTCKHCYRCGREIKVPHKPKWRKTIWRKKPISKNICIGNQALFFDKTVKQDKHHYFTNGSYESYEKSIGCIGCNYQDGDTITFINDNRTIIY